MNISIENLLYLFQISYDSINNPKLLLVTIKNKKNEEILPSVLFIFFINHLIQIAIVSYAPLSNVYETPALTVGILDVINTLLIITFLSILYRLFEKSEFVREFALLTFIILSIVKLTISGIYFLYLTTEMNFFWFLFTIFSTGITIYLIYWFYLILNSNYIKKICYSILSVLFISLLSLTVSFPKDRPMEEYLDFPGNELFSFLKNERPLKQMPIIIFDVIGAVHLEKIKAENYTFKKNEVIQLQTVWSSYYSKKEIEHLLAILEEAKKTKFKFKSTSLILSRKINAIESLLRLNNAFNIDHNSTIEFVTINRAIKDYEYASCKYESLIVSTLRNRRFWNKYSFVSMLIFFEKYEEIYLFPNEPPTTQITLLSGSKFQDRQCKEFVSSGSFSKGFKNK